MIYRFLEFELDETCFELRFEGQPITVQARVFALIAYLLRHRDRVVTKEELVRELWKANAVSDTAISQVVMLARKALRDEGESQRIIRTLRGRGFRFIAEASALQLPAANPQPPAAPAAGRDGLIGRRDELHALLQRSSAARAGRGGLVLIEGEPGIGKTTLADEVAAHAAGSGLDVQWGRAWEEGGAPPFWPWIQVLRGLIKSDGEAAVRGYMGRGVAELLPLLPELARDEAELASDSERARAHFRVFDAMARFLRQACTGRPRLIVLDDLHAVDEASVQMLRFLVPELEQCALLIAGTFRDLELQRQPLLAQLAGSCAESQRIRLKGLCEVDVARWLERSMNRAPSAELTRSLHELSGGNPLLLAELCRRVGSSDQLAELASFASEPLPERILRAVRSHLSELPEPTLEALSTASALGREFALSMLAPLRACSESEVLGLLGPALTRGVVRHGSSPDSLIFAHALVCQAVYTRIPPERRIELHRQIAEQLVQSHAPQRAPLYEIAHHYALAAAGGCRRQALDYARAAALRARDMRAHPVAAELYDRCCALAETEGLANDALHELLCAAGDAWYRVGHLEHTDARLSRAAELGRADRNAERFATAVIARASARRGVMLYDRQLQGQMQEALAMLPDGDSTLRAGLLATSAINARSLATLSERDAASRAGVEMARRLNDDTALAWVLNARHLAIWGWADPSEKLELTREMIQLGRRTGDDEVLLDACLWRISDLREAGDLQGAERAREEYEYEVDRVGSPWHRYMLYTVEVFHAQELGEFARARQCSLRVLDLGLRLREPLVEGFHAVRELFLQIDEGLVHGDPARGAAPCVGDPPEFVPSDYRPLWALPWAIVGRREDAARCLTQLLHQDAAQLVPDSMRRPLLSIMAEVCALLDDRENAARIYPLLAPWAGVTTILQAGVCLGPVSYYLGRLACTLSQPEAAATYFEQALVESAGLPALARTQYAFGRLLADAANSRGRQLLREACTLAERLGMADVCVAAEQALERAPSCAHASGLTNGQ
ncbi:MAG TPA: AAA family ATPase [Polyangiales bacterium]|nr:AAA family ATPase [Polyangiales bacterium]